MGHTLDAGRDTATRAGVTTTRMERGPGFVASPSKNASGMPRAEAFDRVHLPAATNDGWRHDMTRRFTFAA